METDTKMNFSKAFEMVINGFEGKYGYDKDDPGGEIYKGIARKILSD